MDFSLAWLLDRLGLAFGFVWIGFVLLLAWRHLAFALAWFFDLAFGLAWFVLAFGLVLLLALLGFNGLAFGLVWFLALDFAFGLTFDCWLLARL